MSPEAATEFLRSGGVAQQRYEDLRQRWMAAHSGGPWGLARWPCGRRFLHFGLLGLLDEDPTAGGWFATSPASLDAGRCLRVFVGALYAEQRVHRAYQLLLPSAQEMEAVMGAYR